MQFFNEIGIKVKMYTNKFSAQRNSYGKKLFLLKIGTSLLELL